MEIIKKNKIKNIFVGREKKLQALQDILNNIDGDCSDDVFLLLNTPGIGKTKLIKHFGENLMEGKPFINDEMAQDEICKKALYIKHKITNIQTTNEIFEYIIEEAYSQVENRFPHILEGFPQKLVDFRKYEKKPGLLLKIISKKIPIILHLDEFQESIHDENKSIYYELGTFLSGIIEVDPIFPIISGTNFTIINTIGENTISPLNGKVEKIVLTHLTKEEQDLFVNKIICNPQNEKEVKFINQFRSWILINSGGHPRTMVNMAEEFIRQLQLSSFIDLSIPKFFQNLEIKVYEILEKLFWKSKYEKIIQERTKILPPELQNQIIQHILRELESDLKLPDFKTQLYAFVNDYLKNLVRDEIKEDNEIILNLIDNPKSTRKIVDEFLSILVQSGYLLINGKGNFYMLNKYALGSFLLDWNKFLPNWHFIFQDFIQNPYVQEIMQHSPQSFGWTLEIIVKYGILALIRETNQIFPNNYAQLININHLDPFNVPTDYIKHDGDVSLKMIQSFPENNYVILPTAKGIDGLIKNGDRVLMLQITSNKDSPKVKEKFDKFNLYIKNLQKECKGQFEIIPWFLSLKTSSFLEDTVDFSGLITKDTLWNQILAKP